MAFTVSRAVEEYVKGNAFIQESISKGIVNYLALAEEIKPLIERETGKDVKEYAIVMALRRLKDKLEHKFVKKIKFRDSDISIKSDLFEITVKKNAKTFSAVKELPKLIDISRDFLTITHGITQITIISNNRLKRKIYDSFSKGDVIRVIDKLASLSVILPENVVDEAGFFYMVTRAFTWEDIPIVEMVSTLDEMTLIVHERYVPKSFSILQQTIKDNS